VFLHRGPLVQLHLSYPSGRLRSALVLAVVGAAYADAAILPLARNDVLTLVLAVAVALTAVHVFAASSGPARKAGKPALLAALAFAGVLALGAVERLADWHADRVVLWTYDVVIATAAIVLLVDLLRGRWAEAVVTGLVVDLGSAAESGTLAEKLARALGDPTLVVGYRVKQTDGYVDDTGRPLQLPAPGGARTATPLVDHGEEIAVLVHDVAVSADPQLLDSVAAAARIAVANAALQAEAHAKEGELASSRRRIVEAGDAQRRRIERDLRLGAGDQLDAVAASLAAARARLAGEDAAVVAGLEDELADARLELDEFARGVMPAALIDGGLTPALAQLAPRSAVAVELKGAVGRLPESVEAALFFVCAEAIANVGKHAAASRVSINLRSDADSVGVTVADDGKGGADPALGSGLRGLSDRIEALGGRLLVTSPTGGGTQVVAEIPVTASGRA
jgi:signal transduction histidine kinase